MGGLKAENLLNADAVELQLFEDQDGTFQSCDSNWTGKRTIFKFRTDHF